VGVPFFPVPTAGGATIAAPLPRPAGFRTTAEFRQAAEQVSADLAVAMGSA
jgi:hypothetical protein